MISLRANFLHDRSPSPTRYFWTVSLFFFYSFQIFFFCARHYMTIGILIASIFLYHIFMMRKKKQCWNYRNEHFRKMTMKKKERNKKKKTWTTCHKSRATTRPFRVNSRVAENYEHFCDICALFFQHSLYLFQVFFRSNPQHFRIFTRQPLHRNAVVRPKKALFCQHN